MYDLLHRELSVVDRLQALKNLKLTPIGNQVSSEKDCCKCKQDDVKMLIKSRCRNLFPDPISLPSAKLCLHVLGFTCRSTPIHRVENPTDHVAVTSD